MLTVLVTDIFGLNEATIELAQLLRDPVTIVDPYGGRSCGFLSEEEAYSSFTAQGGMAHYTRVVNAAVKEICAPTILIGFSAGASAVWCNTDQAKALSIRRAICFYGSQIRKFPDVSPRCPTTLLFPQDELTFSVPALIATLSSKAFVTCQRTEYSHGFMNKRSIGFHQQAFDYYLEWLNNELNNSPMERPE